VIFSLSLSLSGIWECVVVLLPMFAPWHIEGWQLAGIGYSDEGRDQVHEPKLHRVQVPANQGSSMAQGDLPFCTETLFSSIQPQKF
jgi:hypothetical protein